MEKKPKLTTGDTGSRGLYEQHRDEGDDLGGGGGACGNHCRE